MKYLIISVEKGEGPCGTVDPRTEKPSPGAGGSSEVRPWQHSPRVTGSFVTANNLQLRGKIQLDQILHLSTVCKA